MAWVAVAVAGTALVGSALQSSAASDAANAQAGASANAQAISQQQYQDTVNRNAPFTQAGYGALSALDYGLGITPQTAAGGAPGQAGGQNGMGPGTPAPNGYDPSRGYQMGPAGGLLQ